MNYDPNQPNTTNQPYQQPYQPYPQPGFFPQPPAPAPKKKHTLRNIIISIITVIIIIGVINGVIDAAKSPVTASTSTVATTVVQKAPTTHVKPTATPKPLVWTTIKTLSGNGTEKTDSFTVPANWKLLWSCDPASGPDGYNVSATINNASDDSFVDAGINSQCSASNTSGETNVTASGTLRLDIISEAAWTFKIQVEK